MVMPKFESRTHLKSNNAQHTETETKWATFWNEIFKLIFLNDNVWNFYLNHYSDVIMSAIASQITGVSIVYSTVCSCADQRKHQSSASLDLHRWPVISPHKGPAARKISPFDEVIIFTEICLQGSLPHSPDIFSLADAAWKHPKYPCFCTLPLEFGVNIDIHKHENSEVLCSNRNKSPKEMSGNSRFQIHGNVLIDFIWLNVQAKYLIQTILYHSKGDMAL